MLRANNGFSKSFSYSINHDFLLNLFSCRLLLAATLVLVLLLKLLDGLVPILAQVDYEEQSDHSDAVPTEGVALNWRKQVSLETLYSHEHTENSDFIEDL